MANDKNEKRDMKLNYRKISQSILNHLNPKQREVIERRFGLRDGTRETLESIGRTFGITRERVRQIERDGLKVLQGNKQKIPQAEKAFLLFKDYLQQSGGLRREDVLLKSLGGDQFENDVYFLLTLGENFHRFNENEYHFTFWATEKSVFEKVLESLKHFVGFFEKEKKLATVEELSEMAQKKKIFFHPSVIEIAKKVDASPLGHIGLIDWPEVKPKGVGDRAYLALKLKGKPMHFREIAEAASNLEGSSFVKKRVLPQTVHNELIKDKRFVLIGRGIYALREWGYKEGFVKDIIIDILKSSPKPLTKEEILKKVLEQRMVKPNTVFLNLQDKTLFQKDKQGRYTLKK